MGWLIVWAFAAGCLLMQVVFFTASRDWRQARMSSIWLMISLVWLVITYRGLHQ